MLHPQRLKKTFRGIIQDLPLLFCRCDLKAVADQFQDRYG
jgi:hypothetical protein